MAGIYGDWEERISPNVLDKLGKPTDIWQSDKTSLGYSNVAYQHIHQPALCYPSLADGIVVNTGAAAWELGAFTEIIPVNTISNAYDIHWINVENASNVGVFEIHLYKGLEGAEELIAKIRTSRDTNQSGATNVPVQIAVLPTNSRITAKVASGSGNRNITVSTFYHVYGDA